MDDLSSFRILLVESESNMRDNIRAMLSAHGFSNIQQVGSASAASRRLRDQSYDLILCEYFLGEGQDGQHFLEDARIHRLIPLPTLFIMVTAESSYERVVGAAEFAPSDYVLKPFTAEVLIDRIYKAVEKRDALLPAYRLMELGNLHGAIAYCLEAEEKFPHFLVDLMRLRAELHIAAGEPEAAQAIYAKVLETRAVPWARLGLAKTLFLQGRYEESEESLGELIAENKQYLDAYDWLARVKEAAGQLHDAQRIIERAVHVSPYVVRRLKKLGNVALETGDLSAAERALTEVVRKGKYSDFRDPEDHVRLVTVLVRKGDSDQAQKVVRDLERSMHDLKKTKACRAISSALLLTHKGETDKALDHLARAVEACKEDVGLSSEVKIELARSCLQHQLEDQAAQVIVDVMRNAADPAAVDKAKTVLAEAGRENLAEELALQTRGEVRELIAQGAQKARENQFDEAVHLMTEAARKMPGNPDVLLNASLSILKYLDHRGWNEQLVEQGRRYLERARSISPSHSRIAPLSSYLHELLKKYGIKPGRNL